MRLQKYMMDESISIPSWMLNTFEKLKKELGRMSYDEIESKGREAIKDIINLVDKDEFSKVLKKLGINEKGFKTLIDESIINEDAKHWWNLVKTELFPTLSFYPALQIWLELDKMLRGTPYSGKVLLFYAALWLILISGKHIKQWMDWKKQNPEEYSKERAFGGGGVF